MAVRQLAWWNLSRLASESLSASYNPAGTEAERAKGAAAWKALIPSGTLPTTKPKKK